ncbi:hypothetical protein GQ55_3G088500 [Panicum hallii var. hallii]|uniref:Uncharacterized protein n=1 Tax=Panicum hallii var. hallii TaxID=1504633 RepID=A0A2T7E795_9POAL|nr:hypothetical protein GQ55_3G088500 [Panicum hallii var. hallii]
MKKIDGPRSNQGPTIRAARAITTPAPPPAQICRAPRPTSPAAAAAVARIQDAFARAGLLLVPAPPPSRQRALLPLRLLQSSQALVLACPTRLLLLTLASAPRSEYLSIHPSVPLFLPPRVLVLPAALGACHFLSRTGLSAGFGAALCWIG